MCYYLSTHPVDGYYFNYLDTPSKLFFIILYNSIAISELLD